MIATRQINLYEDVVKVTTHFLGPAAERFVDRQIHNHLGKKPRELAMSDMDELVEWASLAIAVVSNDPDMVRNYSESLMALSNNSYANEKDR